MSSWSLFLIMSMIFTLLIFIFDNQWHDVTSNRIKFLISIGESLVSGVVVSATVITLLFAGSVTGTFIFGGGI